MGDVLNGVFERIFGEAQEGATAIFVAGADPAFRVHMDVAEADVVRIIERHGGRRGLARAGDAIAVEIGDQDIVGIPDFERDGIAALACLPLGLGRQQFPVGDTVEADFGADMMFD